MANRKRKWLRIVIPLVLVVAAVAFFLTRSGSRTQFAQAMASVGNISTAYSFTGSVTAPNKQTLTSPGSATVKEVYVAANDIVSSGDRIARLSDGTIIRSDITGEVVRLDAEKDNAVTAGSELATIMDVAHLEVEISIDEYDVVAVAIGKPADVTINALGVTCQGTIASFDKDATKDGTLATYMAVVAIEAPQGVLPGMQVEVKMLNQSAENVTLLPIEAIQFDTQNRAYVLTSAGKGTFANTYVETGINDGASVQIVSGIVEGTTVYYTDASGTASTVSVMGGKRIAQ